MLRIKWKHMVPDIEVLTRAYTSSMHTLLHKAHVRWAGQEILMPADRLPKQLCYAKRSVGGQTKRFMDTVTKTLTSFNIDYANWEACAQDQPLWCNTIHTGARTAGKNRTAEAQKKRAPRKATLYSITKTLAGPTYTCPECGRGSRPTLD